MILLLAKYWKIILDVVLLVGIIVLIFIWNPFNLFGSGLRLQSTANLVSDIREIGELVTAEYYGEVIASLDEAKLNLLAEDTLNDRAEILYRDLKRDIYEAYEQYVINPVNAASGRRKKNARKKGREDALKAINEDYGIGYQFEKPEDFNKFLNDTLDLILHFANENVLENPVTERFKKGKNRDKFRKNNLENLYNDIEKKNATLSEEDFKIYLTEGFKTEIGFSRFFYDFHEIDTKNHSQLAMIGRGWVKAGFDFGTLDERRFYYDETRDVLHLFGIEPKILNYDINPWFIPERAVPGFEIVQAGRQVDFEDAVKVKTYCRDKLKAYAMEAGILDQAKTYGAEVLKAFFSLLLEKEVKHVRFHSEFHNTYLAKIKQDSIVHWTEIPLIDSVEQEFVRNMEATSSEVLKNVYRRQLKEFMRGLDTLQLQLPDSNATKVDFNYFTHLLPALLENDTLSYENYQKIKWRYRYDINKFLFAPVDTVIKTATFTITDKDIIHTVKIKNSVGTIDTLYSVNATTVNIAKTINNVGIGDTLYLIKNDADTVNVIEMKGQTATGDMLYFIYDTDTIVMTNKLDTITFKKLRNNADSVILLKDDNLKDAKKGITMKNDNKGTITIIIKENLRPYAGNVEDFAKISYWFVDSTLEENPYKIPSDYNSMLSLLDGKRYYKNDTLIADYSFSKDSIQYPMKISKPLVTSMIVIDEEALDTMMTHENLCLMDSLSWLQEIDMELYKAFLIEKNTEYHDKPWIYKLRDKVPSPKEIQKIANNMIKR